MRIETAGNLSLVKPTDPLATVEVDLGSIPEAESFPGLLSEALSTRKSAAKPVTVYCYFGPSINFHSPTSSAFIAVAKDMKLLQEINAHFKSVAGVRCRFSDYVGPDQLIPQVHIQDGTLWKPLDAISWYADAGGLQIDEEEGASDGADEDPLNQVDDAMEDVYLHEDDDDADDKDAEPTSRGVPSRRRSARSDASIGSIIRSIENVYGLPEGSVQLCGPNKRTLRRDAKIGTLRRRWD